MNRSEGWRWLAALPFLLPLTACAAAGKPEVTDANVQAALPELEKLARQTLKQTGAPGMAIANGSWSQYLLVTILLLAIFAFLTTPSVLHSLPQLGLANSSLAVPAPP